MSNKIQHLVVLMLENRTSVEGPQPAFEILASEYARCDRWLASVPGPAWPNRLFAHCASSGGFVDDALRSYPMPSVFGRLAQKRIESRIYFHDVPQALAISELRSDFFSKQVKHFTAFIDDARAGVLPAYSFIEPSYGALEAASSNDALVASVYEAVRASPQWESIALIVIWGEHGSGKPSLPPTAATPPKDGYEGQNGFAFDRLGAQLPTIVVSPWVVKGSVDHQLCDHASIPATLSELFGTSHLTQRDRTATTITKLLSLAKPRKDTPTTLKLRKRANKAAKTKASKRPSATQRALMELARTLPVVAASSSSSTNKGRKQRTVVRPDSIDLRDRVYMPRITSAPPPGLEPSYRPKVVLNQGDTNACTGYALANYLQHLLARAQPARTDRVSPRMLYSMARRYDEFPGWKADEGSTLRAAMKAWFRHGACSLALWPESVAPDAMPPAMPDAKSDWWADAVKRPLGAYYRVDTHAIPDMHAALADVGAIYVSASCHAGWDEGDDLPKHKGVWTIPHRPARRSDGGHAFVIIGYDATGFLILNSWGETWGSRGMARIMYADWLENAMDAWVAQLGVVTEQRKAVASAASLRVEPATKRVHLASEPVLRDHELASFVIDIGNNGVLSDSGRFRTKPDDVSFLLSHHLEAFRKVHGITAKEAVDVAIYAHGGNTTEDTAATTAAHWIPELYSRRVFPIFVMWETGPMQTILNIVEDKLRHEPAAPGRVGGFRSWLDDRIESWVSRPGTGLWNEMKENAAKLTQSPGRTAGLQLLFDAAPQRTVLDPASTRLHLIGHSAGSIVHRHLINYLVGKKKWTIASCNFMAPADRCDYFEADVLKRVGTSVQRYTQIHLSDPVEKRDNCGPYSKSLLYLVSRAFEGERDAQILGMERYLPPRLRALAQPGGPAALFTSPSGAASSARHGDFDCDPVARETVISAIIAATSHA